MLSRTQLFRDAGCPLRHSSLPKHNSCGQRHSCTMIPSPLRLLDNFSCQVLSYVHRWKVLVACRNWLRFNATKDTSRTIVLSSSLPKGTLPCLSVAEPLAHSTQEAHESSLPPVQPKPAWGSQDFQCRCQMSDMFMLQRTHCTELAVCLANTGPGGPPPKVGGAAADSTVARSS